MRFQRWTFAAVALGFLMPAGAFATTIDATALTPPTFRVFPGVGAALGPFNTGSVESLALDAGTYVFTDEANGAFAFDVDASGIVTYNPSFENFLDGSGTTTLTVRGFDVTFDATALTCPTFSVSHIFSTYLSTAMVQNATMLPNDFYPFVDTASNLIVFNLDYNGHFQLVPGSEDYLSGAGTPHLVINGFTVTIDALALTAPSYRIDGITPFAPNTSVLSITGIPGLSYDFRDSASNDFLFEIDPDGLVQYNPGYEDFLDGAGSSQLVVHGFTVTIDALALTAPSYRIDGITPFAPNTSALSITGIPGMSYVFRDNLSNDFLFEIDPDGRLQYNPAYENFLDGDGISALVVDGFPLAIDPCGLAPLTATMSLIGLVPSASTASILNFVGIPGPVSSYSLAAVGELLYFTVDGSGHLAGLPATFVGLPVSGSGTSTLGIGACAGVGSVAGNVTAGCPAAGSPLLGVRVDVFEDGSGDLVGSAVTDASGHYLIENLTAGPYTASIVTPLGYLAATPELAVSVAGGQQAPADFALQCLAVTGSPRGSGFWKHQVGVATGGNGQAQVDATTLCSYLDLIAAHFNNNTTNPVAVYEPPASGACADKLEAAKQLLNLAGSAATIDRAKQQLTALLLNVAAGFVGQTQVVSADGATASQAITYCDNLIDNPTGDHDRARSIAAMVNNGQQVPAGMIPLGTPAIAYGRRPGVPVETGGELDETTLELLIAPNPASGSRTLSFAVGKAGPVSLSIYDVSGRHVADLHRGPVGPGRYTAVWDGRRQGGEVVRQGLYFAHLSAAGRTRVVKVVQAAP